MIGVGRTARDGVRGLADLDEVLGDAEILVNILPLTGETSGMLDARRLGLLPDGALLVNAGRGRTIETAALVEELKAGRIRAVLDVTDPEPLPADHSSGGCPTSSSARTWPATLRGPRSGRSSLPATRSAGSRPASRSSTRSPDTCSSDRAFPLRLWMADQEVHDRVCE